VRVDTSIGGSRLVVFLGGESYIDVRKDVRRDRCEVAEVVRNGHVIHYEPLQARYAPETIIKLIKQFSRRK